MQIEVTQHSFYVSTFCTLSDNLVSTYFTEFFTQSSDVSIVDFQHVLNFVNAGWEGTDEIILER